MAGIGEGNGLRNCRGDYILGLRNNSGLLSRRILRMFCRCAALVVCSAGIIAGCAQVEPVVVVESEEVVESIVTGPLPGVDGSVIEGVATQFDSTFVSFGSEEEAQRSYLAGQPLYEHADSMLTRILGPSGLDLDGGSGGASDTAAFDNANRAAQVALGNAAQAQLRQDTTRAQELLGEAIRHYERALSLNPLHEESRYQLAQVYTLRANYFKQTGAWARVLGLLRELVKLRDGQHGLWAEMAVALENLDEHETAGIIWRRAAETLEDDARLAFAPSSPPIDSATHFLYNVRAYQAFSAIADGEGVYASLNDAWESAPTEDQWDYIHRELIWALWDYNNFRSRLVFDSLQAMTTSAPLDVLDGLERLIPSLERVSARLDAGYVYSVVSYDNGFEDIALDSLKELWGVMNNALTMNAASVGAAEQVTWQSRAQWDVNRASAAIVAEPLPYSAYMENLRTAYSTFLFERAIQHIQDGGSALAFTYLMQVAETGSEYTGRAFVEALKLARYNPTQALKLEPRIEAVYSLMELEDKRVYLRELGDLYRRLGDLDKVSELVDRFRALPVPTNQ